MNEPYDLRLLYVVLQVTRLIPNMTGIHWIFFIIFLTFCLQMTGYEHEIGLKSRPTS